MDVDNTIAARVNGRDMTLRIAREDLPFFEAQVGNSAYALFRSMVAGAWTVAHVTDVLVFAAVGVSQRDRDFFAALGAVSRPRSMFAPKTDDQLHIEATLVSRPVVPYAVLAQQILAATLFGSKGDDLVFSDEADGKE